MEKASDIINELMSRKEFRRKRDVADFFGVSPRALSIWIAKGAIPPKHLLKLSKENLVNEKPEDPQFQSESMSSESESKTVIDYLMRENVRLKQEVESLKNSQSYAKPLSQSGNLIDKIVADSLLICGRVSDGIITEADGMWSEILGYEHDQLVGCRYDEEEWIHPDELARVRRVQEDLKRSKTITESRYSDIQRWKNGKTGEYIMLSMLWDLNIQEDRAIVVCKPIDGFITENGILN